MSLYLFGNQVSKQQVSKYFGDENKKKSIFDYVYF